eukprot:COSAG04_NODE_2668_length_3761_cov_2.355816_4_plen_24_part_01
MPSSVEFVRERWLWNGNDSIEENI